MTGAPGPSHLGTRDSKNKDQMNQPKLRSLAILAALTLQAFAAEPVHLDRKGEHWAQSTLHHMTLEEKIGQMLMIWVHVQYMNTQSPEYQKLTDAIHTYHLGGFGVSVAVVSVMLLLFPVATLAPIVRLPPASLKAMVPLAVVTLVKVTAPLPA